MIKCKCDLFGLPDAGMCRSEARGPQEWVVHSAGWCGVVVPEEALDDYKRDAPWTSTTSTRAGRTA